MASEHDQNSEYLRSRQPGITLDSHQDCSDSTQYSYTGMLLGLPGLMQCAGIGASCNGPVRAEGMRQMQQTHGNRAVQRALSANAPAGRVAVQREEMWYDNEEALSSGLEALTGGETPWPPPAPYQDPTYSEEASSARKIRTTASAASRLGRAGTEGAVKAFEEAEKAKTAAWKPTARPDGGAEIIDAYDEAQKARVSAESSAKYKVGKYLHKGPSSQNKLGSFLGKATGSSNYAGMGLGLANYGFQLWENRSQGQGWGESIFGALGGGFANGQMTKHLFSNPLPLNSKGAIPRTSNRFGPKAGWVDTAVNVVNAGAQLLGAPEEFTTVTQTLADATPSSFATSLASNAGRGLYNLVTGDWEGLKQQGEDLTHGRASAPLQGYASGVEAAYHAISGDSEALDKIRKENSSGKRGIRAQWGSKIGRWARGGGTDEQEENAERRKLMVEYEHFLEPGAEEKRKRDEAGETAQYEKMAQGKYPRPSQEPDALTIRAQAPQEEPSPAVPSALSPENEALYQVLMKANNLNEIENLRRADPKALMMASMEEQNSKNKVEEELSSPAVSMRLP